MKFIGNIHTDIGNLKEVNQDSSCIKVKNTFIGEVALSIVCDGMGGFEDGEVASTSLILFFSKWFDDNIIDLIKSGINFDLIKKNFTKILENQNQKLYEYGNKKNIKVGSTITLLLVIGNCYYIVNVGDTRAYKISDDIYLLTKDNTIVNDDVEKGKLTKEEAINHKESHILSECIGVTSSVNIDFYSGEFKEEEVYLLCSDGFRHEVKIEEIKKAFLPSKMKDIKSIKMQEYRFIEMIKRREEKDNITVSVIKKRKEEIVSELKSEDLNIVLVNLKKIL